MKPIFFDPTGKRGRAISRFAWIAGTICSIALIAFATTLVFVDQPSVGNGDSSARQSIRCAWTPNCAPAHAVTALTTDPDSLRSAKQVAAELREKERLLPPLRPQGETFNHRPVSASLASPSGNALSVGFYVNDDDN